MENGYTDFEKKYIGQVLKRLWLPTDMQFMASQYENCLSKDVLESVLRSCVKNNVPTEELFFTESEIRFFINNMDSFEKIENEQNNTFSNIF